MDDGWPLLTLGPPNPDRACFSKVTGTPTTSPGPTRPFTATAVMFLRDHLWAPCSLSTFSSLSRTSSRPSGVRYGPTIADDLRRLPGSHRPGPALGMS